MIDKSIINDLQRSLGREKILSGEPDLLAYSRDMSIYFAVPDIVVVPTSTSDVKAALAVASKAGIPVTPRGAGTSVTGAVIPIKGGMVIDLSCLNKIKKIDLKNKYAIVEPGVICGELNAALSPGYFFPPDPGSLNIATIGGMIATNASGKSAIKYGTTSDYVMGLEAVLPGGEIIQTGRLAPKASAGFDLTRLFASSEGTLGIITQATLRICHKPETAGLCLAGFKNLEDASLAAVEIVTAGFDMSSCELIDAGSSKGFEREVNLDLSKAGAMLLIESDGTKQAVNSSISMIKDACKRAGAQSTDCFFDFETRNRIWTMRNRLVSAMNAEDRNTRLVPMAEDIGVPVTMMPEALKRTKELAKKYNIKIIMFGHAGDGNIHATFVINPLDADEWKRASEYAAQINTMASEMGGTVSAEHGIGLSKSMFIKKELGNSLDVMKRIKFALDPDNIMNPGKLALSPDNASSEDLADSITPGNAFNQTTHEAATPQERDSMLCMMCGSCRAVCPVFKATGIEADNARSKVQLSYALITKDAEITEDIAQKFFLCTDCGACENNCPSGIKVTEIIKSFQKKIKKKNLLPETVEKSLGNIRKTGNIFGLDQKQRFSASHQITNQNDAAEVLIFCGCSADFKTDKALSALFQILDKAKVKYSLLGDKEQCCGLPIMLSGDEEGFEKHALKMQQIFDDAPPTIISPCPACVHAFNSVYGTISGWDKKSIDIPSFVLELVKNKQILLKNSISKTAVFHDPCYLSRKLNVIEQPRELISRIPGIKLQEFQQSGGKTLCCGGGMHFPEFAPAISQKLADIRTKQANADAIITSCPDCLVQLGSRDIPALDIVELVLESML